MAGWFNIDYIRPPTATKASGVGAGIAAIGDAFSKVADRYTASQKMAQDEAYRQKALDNQILQGDRAQANSDRVFDFQVKNAEAANALAKERLAADIANNNFKNMLERQKHEMDLKYKNSLIDYYGALGASKTAGGGGGVAAFKLPDGVPDGYVPLTGAALKYFGEFGDGSRAVSTKKDGWFIDPRYLAALEMDAANRAGE